MAKVFNVNVPANSWVNLNAATGIVAGSGCTIQNVGSSFIRLQESATEPETTSEGKLISPMDKPYGEAYVPSCTDPLWAYMVKETGSVGVVTMQEISK